MKDWKKSSKNSYTKYHKGIPVESISISKSSQTDTWFISVSGNTIRNLIQTKSQAMSFARKYMKNN